MSYEKEKTNDYSNLADLGITNSIILMWMDDKPQGIRIDEWIDKCIKWYDTGMGKK